MGSLMWGVFAGDLCPGQRWSRQGQLKSPSAVVARARLDGSWGFDVISGFRISFCIPTSHSLMQNGTLVTSVKPGISRELLAFRDYCQVLASTEAHRLRFAF